MFSDSVDQKPIMHMRDGQNSFQKPPPQPHATNALTTAGRLAPRIPKEARANTGKGMPYLGPACPVSSIGISTITLARAMVNTACFQSMPTAIRPEARVQEAVLWAMPTHRAEKLYVVQVRFSTGTGSRSSLAYGPLGSGDPGAISTRPSARVTWAVGGMAVGAVSVMGRPINEGWVRKGRAGSPVPSPGRGGGEHWSGGEGS